MKVAIPTWQGRVSPVFDVAGQLLLVEMDGSCERTRREIALAEEQPEARVERLAQLHVDTLICGAISRPLESLLADRGIEVIARVCGEVDEILVAFAAGAVRSEQFAMPGCCGQPKRRRQQGRCRRGGRMQAKGRNNG